MKTGRNQGLVRTRPLTQLVEIAMNAISNILTQAGTEAKPETSSFKTIVLFCCLGLVASLLLVACGLDLGVGPF